MFYPTISDIDGLVNRESLSSDHILNYQVPGTGQNFMQVLNNSSPSLLQKISKAEGNDLSRACAAGIEKLKAAGLDNVDMAIVMKSFVDEAKGGVSWYSNPDQIKSCFGQTPAIQSDVEAIYGPPSVATQRD